MCQQSFSNLPFSFRLDEKAVCHRRMTGKIFLEQNINLTNIDQFGFGKSQFFYDPNFFNETIKCQGFFSPNNPNFY